MKYTLNLNLPQNSIDEYGNIKPSAVLNIFQSAATEHSIELGCSYTQMKAKNLLWVVSRIYYKVIKSDFVGQEITVTTWPLAPNRLGYERDYLVTDKNGDIIINAISSPALVKKSSSALSPKMSVASELSSKIMV